MRFHRHLAIRKRVSKHLEPYPSTHFWKRLLDTLVYTVGILGPLATIPQVYKIYAFEDATGISPLSWILWAVMDIPWILYGLAHREYPLVLTYTLWCVFNSLVFIGALLYG